MIEGEDTAADGQPAVTAGAPPPAQVRHPFEFRGHGSEFFRVWIVNIALTLVTLGIYGPWAKVRTQRYFLGNTYVDDHPFDYHASALRILIGRVIALAVFLIYNVSVGFRPNLIFLWMLLFLVLIPWLIMSSLRFNARNSSYRNVRFNFTGRYADTLVAYVVWPAVAYATLFLMLPFARRARDKFYVSHHTYGGRAFDTDIPLGRMYLIYGGGILFYIVYLFAFFTAVGFAGPVFAGNNGNMAFIEFLAFVFAAFIFFIPFTLASTLIATWVFNIVIGNAHLDAHLLESRLSGWRMAWIVTTNMLLTLVTLGIFYPFGRVRLARAYANGLALISAGDLGAFTGEALAQQSAIGQEVGGFFDLGIGI